MPTTHKVGELYLFPEDENSRTIESKAYPSGSIVSGGQKRHKSGSTKAAYAGVLVIFRGTDFPDFSVAHLSKPP